MQCSRKITAANFRNTFGYIRGLGPVTPGVGEVGLAVAESNKHFSKY